jgi:hypothetical protein
MSLYHEIKALEESIALTEYYLANCKSEWDSLLICYNDGNGLPYSAYASNEEVDALQMAIEEHEVCLYKDRRTLEILSHKQQLEIEERKKADEELMKMCEEDLKVRAEEKKAEEKK